MVDPFICHSWHGILMFNYHREACLQNVANHQRQFWQALWDLLLPQLRNHYITLMYIINPKNRNDRFLTLTVGPVILGHRAARNDFIPSQRGWVSLGGQLSAAES